MREDLAIELQKRLLHAERFDSFLESLQNLILDAQSENGTPQKKDRRQGSRVFTRMGKTVVAKPHRERRVVSDNEVRGIRKAWDEKRSCREISKEFDRAESVIRGIGTRKSRAGVK